MRMNNVFQTVNSRGKTRKHVNTQRMFFKYLTTNKHMLNALLYRFDSTRSVQGRGIVQDIQLKRQSLGYDMSIHIESNIVFNHNPSVYIAYLKDNIRRYHFSIHLCPNCFIKTTNGVIHFKSNMYPQNTKITQRTPRNTVTQKKNQPAQKQPYVILHVYGRPDDPEIPYFSLDMTKNKNVSYQPLLQEASVIVDVLNSYFDPQNPKFIGKNPNQPTHKYTSAIYNKMIHSIQQT